MVYCVKCKKELTPSTKFCPECGTPVGSSISGEHTQREHVYVGVVKKCPVCGEELSSMVAVCPACGHEINSTQVHPALQKFINELALCDQSIADEETINAITNEKKAGQGWHSWSTTAKILWVVVNCLTFCVPIVVYLLFRFRILHKSAPSIKRKANLIENFQIPSERQAIIESLYFIHDKASALAAQKVTSDTAYWAKLWEVKSSQIYKKAQAAIPNDVTALGLYHEIAMSVQQVKTASKRKNMLLDIIAIAYIVAVVAIEAFAINRLSQITNALSASSFLPIILGFCAALLLAFFIWTVKKNPNILKKGITVVICIALIISVRSCQNNATNFTTQIGDICRDNNMILSDVDMNELTKVASIEIQSSIYDKEKIDKAETELFDIAREYKFELQIAFVDSEYFTIRVSQIDEHGAVKHSADKTNGIIEFVRAKCIEQGAKLDKIYNFLDSEITISIQVPTVDRTVVMDNLQQELFAARTQFGYSECKIEFRTMDKYYGDLLRNIEVSADESISLEERVSEFNQTTIDEILASAITKCKEQKINMDIKVSNDHGEILWKSFVDANGNQTNVDVYHFQIEAQEICENNGATIENIGISNREISFNVYVNSRRRGKIDKLEEELINAYQTYSDLAEMSFTFWDDDYPSEEDKVYDMDLHGSEFFDKLKEVEQKHRIRDTDVDSTGMIVHSNDNTKLI